jgi:ATP-binding cassette subfamily B protein
VIEADALAWPVARAVEAIEAAARHAGMPIREKADAAPIWGASELGELAFDRWVEASARWLGVEAEPLLVTHAEVESLLLRSHPSLLRIPGEDRLLAAVGRRGDRVTLITPDLATASVPVAFLRDLLCRVVEAPLEAQLETWLAPIVGSPRRRQRARSALSRELLDKTIVTRCWLVRIPPGASFVQQLRFEGVVGRMAMVLAAHGAQLLMGLAAWYTLASGAYGGGIDRDWLVAWALLMAGAVPVQIFTSAVQAEVVLGTSVLLKRRVLAGTLRVAPDVLRRDGAGQLLGRALDASAVEVLATSGGLFAVLALVEVVVVAVVAALGPGGALRAIAFVLWTALTMWLCWRAHLRAQRWTHVRRELTSDLVEQMVGHRTRLAQQAPAKWHDGEDEALDRYLGASTAMDAGDLLARAMPQAWFVVGLLTILPGIADGTSGAGGLAVAVGSLLLGGAALGRLTSGAAQISSVATAWREVKPLYDAAAAPEIRPSPVFVASHLVGTGDPDARSPVASDVPLVDATDLVYAYDRRPQPVLREGSMQIRRGDHILLEGPSGGGKSTFASLLAGLRRPSSGLLLLEGLDWQTVGPDGWRRGVAAAPQFHENHVLSETFLFNLLMGRRWPPSMRDIADATEICRELGLGDLLKRMPAGLMQMVGETGWRLSHGECSRLYIARALLQDAKVVVLDESFAALDPGTVEECLRCVLKRAPAVVVIAHP